MSQVLDPMHEILNSCPGIAVMCSKDRFYWVEFRLFGYYGGFSTHWAHVSIPPIAAVLFIKFFGKLRPGRSSRLFSLCSGEEWESSLSEELTMK
jgi:hypothetical protein